MPKDTIWLDNGKFIELDSSVELNDATITELIDESNNSSNRNQYAEDKAYYDNLGNYIVLLLLCCFTLFIRYAYKKAKHKRENPLEDHSDWVEIGSGPILGTQHEKEDYAIMQIQKKRLSPPVLVYNGRDLHFKNEQILSVLTKRFPYFNNLSTENKNKFLSRHKRFLRDKKFKIHDKSGFKEMPILLSATAIQLSFGLEEFMLQDYKNIHIFPEEFLGTYPTIRFLAGNVSDDCINISWKHYLEGYENKEDGQNVGLHEMAHAYYTQHLMYDEDKGSSFVNSYNKFAKEGSVIFEEEKLVNKNLYSDYGLRNIQEFWAESVEIFFEKPLIMKDEYPELYLLMSKLLNQNMV